MGSQLWRTFCCKESFLGRVYDARNHGWRGFPSPCQCGCGKKIFHVRGHWFDRNRTKVWSNQSFGRQELKNSGVMRVVAELYLTKPVFIFFSFFCHPPMCFPCNCSFLIITFHCKFLFTGQSFNKSVGSNYAKIVFHYYCFDKENMFNIFNKKMQKNIKASHHVASEYSNIRCRDQSMLKTCCYKIHLRMIGYSC